MSSNYAFVVTTAREQGHRVLTATQFRNELTDEQAIWVTEAFATGKYTVDEICKHFLVKWKYSAGKEAFLHLWKGTGPFKDYDHAALPPRALARVRAKFYRKPSAGQSAAPKKCRRQLLEDALEAYEPWAKAKAAVLADGVTEENLKAWLAITLEDV